MIDSGEHPVEAVAKLVQGDADAVRGQRIDGDVPPV